MWNIVKQGHFARDCRAPKKKRPVEGNAATSEDNNIKKDESEEEWRVYLSTISEQSDVFNHEFEHLALTVIDMETNTNLAVTNHSNRIDYSKDWIVDSECSNHMAGDESKLLSKNEYKGKRMVVTQTMRNYQSLMLVVLYVHQSRAKMQFFFKMCIMFP